MNIKSKQGSAIVIGLTLIASLALVIVITTMLLKSDTDINQGTFRINDVVIKSTVVAADKTTDLKKWELDISQDNNISILVAKEANSAMSKIYIDNIKFEGPNKAGELYIMPKDTETKYLANEITDKSIELFPKDKDGCYVIELLINNRQFLTNYKVPDGTKDIKYDGTLLKLANIPVDEIKFNVKFNVNIVDTKGNINICTFDLNMPEGNIIDDGSVVNRLDANNFSFKVQEAIK